MDLTQLPPEFAELQDLADRFAISDDLDRESATDAATLAEKQQLVARLNPRFEAINTYLDEHDDESAHLLGRLAEAGCEVQIEISQQS
jgi:hypothetical protein